MALKDMVADQSFRYGTRRLKPGDGFQVPARLVPAFIALKRAHEGRVKSKVVAPSSKVARKIAERQPEPEAQEPVVLFSDPVDTPPAEHVDPVVSTLVEPEVVFENNEIQIDGDDDHDDEKDDQIDAFDAVAFIDRPISKIAPELAERSNNELTSIAAAERKGQKRKGVLNAVKDERENRKTTPVVEDGDEGDHSVSAVTTGDVAGKSGNADGE